MAIATAPGSTRPSSMQARRPSLGDITTKPKNLPSRAIMHGTSGIGKTSWAVYAPSPLVMMSKGEQGVESLKDAGLVPESVGVLPECLTWQQALDCVEMLTREEHSYKSLILDTINGFEKTCHDHVCDRDYGSQYASFAAYQNGYKVAVGDWRQLLAALDKLREVKRMAVIMLAHTKVTNFKNPEGFDYDRYIPDMSPETWSVTHGWADMVLFANYDTTAQKDRGQSKAKAKGGENRFIYTSRRAAWDAKNRYSLPEIISMGDSGREAWANFQQAVAEARAAQTQKAVQS